MQSKNLMVPPVVPPALAPLARALSNFAWSYDAQAAAVRAAFAAKLGLSERESMFAALLRTTPEQQRELGADSALLALAAAANAALDAKPKGDHGLPKDALVAYFSAEYGVHESLPIYAGGLGILSGDHLKSASDLGLPLVAVGLFYRYGYHEQTIGSDKAVHERYVENDPIALGGALCTHPDGRPLLVHVQLPGRHLHMQAWEFRIGRTSLYLLDTNVAENNDADRRITERLYGGDHHTRIEQELALGVGGTFMLEALGKKPTAYHLNEGHAAFLTFARLHMAQRDHGFSLEEAHEYVAASNVFTTHTPIAAGNDVFSHGVLHPYLVPLCEALRLPLSWVLELGNESTGHVESHPETPFSMTAFALRSCEHRNGVSLEHGDVSRALWHRLWPGLTRTEVPIGAIVNGVHMRTWSHPRMQKHYSASRTDHAAFWADKRALRKALLDRVNASRALDRHFSPDVLTLGFARRFAEYKRALLLFSDPARLQRLLANADRPVQLLFSGKAHPNNLREKANIKALQELIEHHGLSARVAFIENYDIEVARALVQGVDVWLNLPRPPLEASGTSGMKIVENGGLNVSVQDGWWKEAYAPGIGWAVGALHDEVVPYDDASRDALDALDLYRILETEVAPLFYQRESGAPREWIDRCVASGKKLAAHFDAIRMVDAYAKQFYSKASAPFDRGEIKRRVERHQRILAALPSVRVEWVEAPSLDERKISVRARIHSAGLSPDDLQTDVLLGRARSPSADPFDWENVRVQPLLLQPEGEHVFIGTAELVAPSHGSAQLGLRVLPRSGSSRMAQLCVFA